MWLAILGRQGLGSPIHKFYYDRLHNDVKFTKHYYPTTPGFSGDNAVQFDDFIALPWIRVLQEGRTDSRSSWSNFTKNVGQFGTRR